MPNPIIQQYIDGHKTAGRPYITTDTQIVSGRVVLTVSPSVASDTIHSYRMEFPDVRELQECPYPILLLAAVFGYEVTTDLIRFIGPAMHAQQTYSRQIGSQIFRTFSEGGDHYVIEIVDTPQQKV
jgi:hypothetical protein